MMIHGEGPRYFSEDAYATWPLTRNNSDNKELLIILIANHTDLYDGGDKNAIPFDKLQSSLTNLKWFQSGEQSDVIEIEEQSTRNL